MKQASRFLPFPKLPRRQLLHGSILRRGVDCHMHRHHANRRHHDFLRAVQRRSLQRKPRKAEIGVGERALVDQPIKRQRLQQPGQVRNARARRELQQQRRRDHLQPDALRHRLFPRFRLRKTRRRTAASARSRRKDTAALYAG